MEGAQTHLRRAPSYGHPDFLRVTPSEGKRSVEDAPEISVVVPVYQAEDCLLELHRRICASLEAKNLTFELILVDDHSRDNSWLTIKQLSRVDSRVKGIRFSRNFGQHYGITAGIDNCTGKWTVVMDCDLQDQPEEIPHLYAEAQKGFDVVLARRSGRRDLWYKRLTSFLFYRFFSYLADFKYDGEVGNFRIVSRKVVENYARMRENLRFFGAQVQWLGFATHTIDVQHAPRFAGSSSYSLSKLLDLATQTIIAFSDKPLRLAVRAGFIMASCSVLAGSYIVARGLLHQTPVLGWSSLMASIYFLGGINIALLGMIGTYLGKTFAETKKRPLYIIDEISGTQNHAQH